MRSRRIQDRRKIPALDLHMEDSRDRGNPASGLKGAEPTSQRELYMGIRRESVYTSNNRKTWQW
jgi:hypothetical protein